MGYIVRLDHSLHSASIACASLLMTTDGLQQACYRYLVSSDDVALFRAVNDCSHIPSSANHAVAGLAVSKWEAAMKLLNKVAFVTGAGQGIGQAIVQQFAEQGAVVVAADINLAAAQKTVAGLGDKAMAVSCNVADSDSVATAMAAVVARFGQLDILVNNAGIGSIDAFAQTPDENWQRVIGVNLTGTFFCSREAVKLMLEKATPGVVINISSTAAMTGEGPSHYCAAKAGVMGLTRSMARELASQGIRVNTIVPGPTNTPMMADIPEDWMQAMLKAIPLGRMGETDEIARVAAFLASDDASFITGQNLAVNGGMAFI